MRLLHIADLHIGKSVCEFPMLEDLRHVLGQVLRVAKEQDVRAILVAGDLYDKSSPSSEAVALLDWFLAQAAGAGHAVFAVSGNHDSPERIAYASGLLSKLDVFFSPVFDGTVSRHTLEDDFGPVTFWLLPFLKPATVRHFFPGSDIGSPTDAVRTVLESCPVDASQRNVLLAHQFVTAAGAQTLRSDSESVVVGTLENVDCSAFDAFDYVALGHVHRPQRVGRDAVRYSGSPLKYSFSEIRQPKGALLIDLGPKGSVDVSTVALAPLHDLREIRGHVSELLSPDVLADLTESDKLDYLHVVLRDDEPGIDALGRLRATYPNIMAIEYQRDLDLLDTASRDDGDVCDISDDDPPDQLFRDFFERQNGRPMTDAQERIALDALQAIGVM